jgi:hypothetical protein
VAIWYIFPRTGMLCRETSGSPDRQKLGHSSLEKNETNKLTRFCKVALRTKV